MITKEFLNEILLPATKKLKQAFKLVEEKLKALDSIKISDINDLTKTAYLVKDKNEIEKVNKNTIKRKKRIEKVCKRYEKKFNFRAKVKLNKNFKT